MNIDASTSLYCLIGHPIEKSLSPEIHNYSFEKNKINARYLALDVLPENLEKAVDGIRNLSIRGVNVTIPHKQEIIKYLDDVDEEARLLGAVNTVKNENGRLKGYNTDARGFIDVLKDKDVEIRDKNIVILGAGGAARAIAIMLSREGVREISILNRTLKRAESVADEINNALLKEKAHAYEIGDKDFDFTKVDILINSTSVGMYPNDTEMPIDPMMLKKEAVVCDIVYKPLQTKLLKVASLNGNKTIGGLNMLIYQAMLSEEIWLDKKINKDMVIDWFKEKL